MNKQQIFEILSAKYHHLSDPLKIALAERSKIVKLKKGAILVKHYSTSDKIWFVASGSTRACYIKDGRTICDWFTFDPEFVCAITSFFSGKPSLHQIDTISDSVLLEITGKDIQYLCDTFHDFERIGRLSTTETMLRLQEKIVAIQFESAADRLNNLLQKHPDIYKRIALGDIASYIGITKETLSRLRSNRKSA